MKAQAKTTGARISTRKVQLVADVIRGKSVDQALRLLSTTPKRGATILVKTIKSAVANAVSKKADENALYIERLDITGGDFLRRYHFAARGRTRPYTKRSTHITVVLSDEKKGTKETKETKKSEEKKGESK